jgi:phosphoglycerate dehydrogenase-like enzyme
MNPLIWIIDEEWSDYEVEKKLLLEKYPDCTIKHSTYDYLKDLEDFGKQADGILSQVYTYLPGAVIRTLEKCKGIAVYGGGYDRIDTLTARTCGISVTNVSDYCKEDLADYVMACIYHFNKRLLTFNAPMMQGFWGAQAISKPARRIAGSTLMIIGLGRIGKTIAAKGKALGMRVVAYDPYVDQEVMSHFGVEKVTMEIGLAEADFVSVNAILNHETEGLLTYSDFKRMKRSAYLINTARGKIIIERDLIQAVNEKLISGACLDVIETEPPTLKEAIFQCPEILVTPHISYISEQSYEELKRRSVENLIQMLEDNIPEDLVN